LVRGVRIGDRSRLEIGEARVARGDAFAEWVSRDVESSRIEVEADRIQHE